jgi:hypothetical protein
MAKIVVFAFCIFVVLLNIASIPTSTAARLLGNNKTNMSNPHKVKSYMLDNGLGLTPPMG